LPVKGISCRTGALAAQVASAAMDLLASSSTNSAISPLGSRGRARGMAFVQAVRDHETPGESVQHSPRHRAVLPLWLLRLRQFACRTFRQ
jgi:hypothetical protein